MGKHFGELAFIRGIIYYSISPHEQRAFAGCVTFGIPNFLTRALPTMWTWLPPFITTIAVYNMVEAGYKQRMRKDPADYVNEVNPDA